MYVKNRLRLYINGKLISKVVHIDIENNSRNIGASCDITLPLLKRLQSDKLPEQEIIPFNGGDKVEVYVKYDGFESYGTTQLPDAETNEEKKNKYLKLFSGFVHSFTLGNPIKIKCLDYVYWMNLAYCGDTPITTYKKYVDKKTGQYKYELDKDKSQIVERVGVGLSWKDRVSFVEVLNALVHWGNILIAKQNDDIKKEGGDISAQVTPIELYKYDKDPDKPIVFDMKLEDIHFIKMTPAAILEHFKRALGLCITFVDNKLYVNVASFVAGKVKLNSAKNVIGCNLQTNNVLDQRRKTARGTVSVFSRIAVKTYFFNEIGEKQSFIVGDELGEVKEVFYYNIKPGKLGSDDIPVNYKELAEKALLKYQQTAYDGEVTTLIYPYFDIFWDVYYKDMRFEDRNAHYICVGVKYTIAESGYHRTALLAFLENEKESEKE